MKLHSPELSSIVTYDIFFCLHSFTMPSAQKDVKPFTIYIMVSTHTLYNYQHEYVWMVMPVFLVCILNSDLREQRNLLIHIMYNIILEAFLLPKYLFSVYCAIYSITNFCISLYPNDSTVVNICVFIYHWIGEWRCLTCSLCNKQNDYLNKTYASTFHHLPRLKSLLPYQYSLWNHLGLQ